MYKILGEIKSKSWGKTKVSISENIVQVDNSDGFESSFIELDKSEVEELIKLLTQSLDKIK